MYQMKVYIPFLIIVSLTFNSCLFFIRPEDKGGIEVCGKTFNKTEFVTVIPEGKSVTIPDGKNLTYIDDVFHEKRDITLTGYTMCKYEVTQELYEYVMGENPYPDSENHYGNENQKLRPVAGVSWYDAIVFCNKLSELCGYEPVYEISNILYAYKGKPQQYIKSADVGWPVDMNKNGFRLPTEAEWEFAARGAGKTSEDWNSRWSGGNNSKKVAWTSLTSSGYSDDDDTLRTHEVGLKQPNALGIFDMSGNVSEWCADWYRSITEDNNTSHGNAVKDEGINYNTGHAYLTNPCLAKGKYDNHVIRGGSYTESAGTAINWQRRGFIAYGSYNYSASCNDIGFRLVRRP